MARHGYTNYDGLLKAGVSFNDAREAILESINSKIFEWHGRNGSPNGRGGLRSVKGAMRQNERKLTPSNCEIWPKG